MGVIVNLVLLKFIESLVLLYANIRQKAVLERLTRVPIDLSFAFSISDLDTAREKLSRKINHDMLLTFWDLFLFSAACFSPGLFRSLWDAAKDPDPYKDDPSFQPSLFTIAVTLLFWFFRGHLASASHHFICLGKSISRRAILSWWIDSFAGNCSLLMDTILQALLVQISISYYGSSAKLALASGSLVFYLGSFLLLGPALHEPDDRPFVDLPEGRLKARLLSLAAVFGLSPSQVLFADNCTSKERRTLMVEP